MPHAGSITHPTHSHPTLTYLNQIPLHELVEQSLAKGSGAPLNNDTGSFKSRDLRISTAFAAANDGTSVTHATAWGSADTGNESNCGLVVLVVGLEELGSILLSATTDLTDHDDTISLLVLKEDLQAVNEVGAGERIATDTNDEGLTESSLSGLVDGLVGQGTGTGNNTDTATLVDEPRHDTNLALALYHCKYLSKYTHKMTR